MKMFDEHFGAYENVYGLPAGLLAAVAQQESSGNQWACRYEPGFYATYINGKDRKALGGLWPASVSEPTERVARATSYGLLQLMGQVAREQGFVGIYLTQLCDPETGIRFGASHLATKIKKYGLEDGLSAYNSGIPTAGNRATYVDPILARMKK